MNYIVKSIELNNEYVRKIELNKSFEEKPLFRTLTNLEPHVAIKWIDRFSPLEAIHCEWAMAELFSQVGGYIIPRRAEYLRCVLTEMQNIVFYLSYLSKIFYYLKDDIRYEQALIVREKWFEVFEVWTGSRLLPQILSLPGVDKDLTLGIQNKLKANLKQASKQFIDYFSDLENDDFYKKKLSGFAPISEEEIEKYFLGGICASSIGLVQSLRGHSDFSYWEHIEKRCYKDILSVHERELSLKVSDAWKRLKLVLFEIKESMAALSKILDKIPQGDYNFPVENIYIPQSSFLTAGVDAPSGPIFISYINAKYNISNFSTRISPIIENLLIGIHHEDVELALASLAYDISSGSICG